MPFIYLVPLSRDLKKELSVIEEITYRVFKINTKHVSLNLDISASFDPARNQYNSSILLGKIIENSPPDAIKIMGVINLDLFLPIFTFQFGQAQLGGLSAILSTFRLHNKFYGLEEDTALYEERIRKEAVHELGHTFGLVHCYNPVCVMRSSTYVENVDQKSLDFCSTCWSGLIKNIRR